MKQCPFCGEKKYLYLTTIPTVKNDKNFEWGVVRCVACGATGPIATTDTKAELFWDTRKDSE